MSSSAMAVPFFGVDVDLFQVGVDIRVNGIPVYFDDKKGQLNVEVPTPENIVDGINSLSVSVSKPYDGKVQVEDFDPNAYVRLSMFEQELPAGEKKIHLSLVVKLNKDGVFEILEPFASNGNSLKVKTTEKSGYKNYMLSGEIKSPFPRWRWQDGKKIEDNQQTYDSLLAVYQELYDAMKAKDTNVVKAFYSDRAEEIAIAYGVEDGHKKLSTGKDMLDPELDLYAFHTKGVFLDVIGNGKLARIKSDSNIQPIFFYDKKARQLHLYKFAFYLDKNGKWIMIR